MTTGAIPIPADPDEVDQLLSEGWAIESEHGGPFCMVPPKRLQELLGFARFVQITKAEAVTPERVSAALDRAWLRSHDAQGQPRPPDLAGLLAEELGR